MGMGVIHSQQAGTHCDVEKISPLRGPLRFRIKFFKICILAKAARALRRLLANARGPPVRAANILHIVVEVKAVFPTRRRARWNSMAVDGARFVERGPCCRV